MPEVLPASKSEHQDSPSSGIVTADMQVAAHLSCFRWNVSRAHVPVSASDYTVKSRREHLEDVDGVNVRVAHLDKLPQGRVVLAQVLMLRHLHIHPDC